MHVKNILLNLLDNSVKYSIEKPIIKVTTRNSKDYIAIEVKDNGKGISKDDQKRIATPENALQNGSDYLVIGRPILESPDPRQTVESLFQRLKNLSL